MATESSPSQLLDTLLAELKLRSPRTWMTVTNSQGALSSKSLRKLCRQRAIPIAEEQDDVDVLRAVLEAEASVASFSAARGGGYAGSRARPDEHWLSDEFKRLCGAHAENQKQALTFEDWLSWDWLRDRIGPPGSKAMITLQGAQDLWTRVVTNSIGTEADTGRALAREQNFLDLAEALHTECGVATVLQSALRGRAVRQQKPQLQALQASSRLEGVVTLAPFNPTPVCAIAQALDALQVGPGDTLYDLGCGDGRLLLAAARRGAVAVGVEYDQVLAEKARVSISEACMSESASVICGDACATDLSPATKIFVYLVPDGLRRMQAALAAALRSGTQIASYTFSLPGWEPSQELSAETRARECRVFVYSSVDSLPADSVVTQA
eukprot:TRINITY_DN14655_c0_g1_i2.p1 TRINITY_DN14655_c0_g1~~TRINITY_DN14655_c0_g1_i2.p1  ORF type:complete len:382 (-),score=67.14 TRINITY_DN14655_c0_g1_i2:208-1353(-)